MVSKTFLTIWKILSLKIWLQYKKFWKTFFMISKILSLPVGLVTSPAPLAVPSLAQLSFSFWSSLCTLIIPIEICDTFQLPLTSSMWFLRQLWRQSGDLSERRTASGTWSYGEHPLQPPLSGEREEVSNSSDRGKGHYFLMSVKEKPEKAGTIEYFSP